MDIGNYSVEILGTPTVRRHANHLTGYVPMTHGEYFQIRMRNRSGHRTLAEVVVNGQDCGTFVLSRYGTATTRNTSSSSTGLGRKRLPRRSCGPGMLPMGWCRSRSGRRSRW
jgi:hypothetical protein